MRFTERELFVIIACILRLVDSQIAHEINACKGGRVSEASYRLLQGDIINIKYTSLDDFSSSCECLLRPGDSDSTIQFYPEFYITQNMSCGETNASSICYSMLYSVCQSSTRCEVFDMAIAGSELADIFNTHNFTTRVHQYHRFTLNITYEGHVAVGTPLAGFIMTFETITNRLEAIEIVCGPTHSSDERFEVPGQDTAPDHVTQSPGASDHEQSEGSAGDDSKPGSLVIGLAVGLVVLGGLAILAGIAFFVIYRNKKPNGGREHENENQIQRNSSEDVDVMEQDIIRKPPTYTTVMREKKATAPLTDNTYTMKSAEALSHPATPSAPCRDSHTELNEAIGHLDAAIQDDVHPKELESKLH